MKKINFFLIFMLTSFLLFTDEKGYQIAKKNKDLKKSKDSYSETEMILINKNGDKKRRKFINYSKEGNEGRNSFVEFLEPVDVKGTKFLTLAKKGDDEQRLYLPSLKKTRLIASSGKSGKFMGSDLYYYDMEDRDLNDFEYKYIKEEKFQNIDCFVIEATPKNKNSPYSKSFMWISKNDYFNYKIEAYDKKDDKLLKKIVFVEVKEIEGILNPIKIVVENEKESTKTLLIINNIKINSGIKDEIFTIQNLEK